MRTFNILLLNVPQEDGEVGDEEHLTNKLHDVVTRDGVEYRRTKKKLELDGETFTVYSKEDV